MDCPNDALFPFGYGLSYHTVRYDNLRLSSAEMPSSGSCGITVKVDVTNESTVAGTEVVQLYIHDRVGTRVRPMLELRDFARVELEPGESRTVSFELCEEELRFWTPEHGWASESGAFEVLAGPNSRDLVSAELALV